MADKSLIHSYYNTTKSYAETARRFGISRQRVHQVVKNYKNYGRMTRQALYEKVWTPICRMCNIRPSEHLHHKDGDNANEDIHNLTSVCITCHDLAHLILKYGKNCSDCGISFQAKKHGGKGKCRNCYANHQYRKIAKTSEYREYARHQKHNRARREGRIMVKYIPCSFCKKKLL